MTEPLINNIDNARITIYLVSILYTVFKDWVALWEM